METTMNETLLYLSRHNVWATKTLLGACRELSPAQLSAPGTATYGSIIETFNHLVMADGEYLSSLGGAETSWVATSRERSSTDGLERWSDDLGNDEATRRFLAEYHGADLDELGERVEETGRLWESFLAFASFDADRVTVLDDGTYECPAGIVMAQVFHHGTLHREQICAMLTALAIEPPDLQPWAFADATCLSRFLGGRTR
jgi:uncharacterized damage-inducible protein DinB